MLSEDQLSLLVGFACFMRNSLKPLHRNDLQQFCISHLGKTPSLPTISRIMTESGFSFQKSMTRNSRMVSEEVVEDALDAILELRSYEFAPDQLLFMDETGLWSNVSAPKTYHFANWYFIPRLPFLTAFLPTHLATSEPTGFPFLLSRHSQFTSSAQIPRTDTKPQEQPSGERGGRSVSRHCGTDGQRRWC